MTNKPEFSILVVDDDRTNLDVLSHILKSQYTVQIAKSGSAALKRVIDQQPDLILLDIVMPDMNGFEVLAELKALDSTRHIPVIFITGLVHAEDEEKGFLLGAVDYIAKPFNTSVVKARVRTHLRIVKQMRTIERLCMIDALTDINNRRGFDQKMEQEWLRASRDHSPISLLMVDVDKFKHFNDTYGHPQGDILLQALAGVLASVPCRPGDFVARLGGEEFAVVLPETTADGAMVLAEKVRKAVEDLRIPHTEDTPMLSITVSIGVVSQVPDTTFPLSDFISRADEALYKAKNAGRNRACLYTPPTDAA